MAAEDGPSWVDPKKRPRPPALSRQHEEVSRESGLSTTTGTMGKSIRFPKSGGKVTGPGHSSPYGHVFYQRNALYKNPYLEEDVSCTQGIGDRPEMVAGSAPKTVGPGSYEIVTSAKGQTSALDGPDYAKTTMKMKLPSSLVAAKMCGPNAMYNVPRDLITKNPFPAKHPPGHKKAGQIKKEFQALARGGRDYDFEDKSGPGPCAYKLDTYKSVAMAASCPNLSNSGERCMEATGGSKRKVGSSASGPLAARACTFGGSERFPSAKQSCSPQGNLYYAHSKILDQEEYLRGARSCSFGACGKTDFANPLKAYQQKEDYERSPVSHQPPSHGYSGVKRTSALDGVTYRPISPVHAFCKTLGKKNASIRSRSSPQGSD